MKLSTTQRHYVFAAVFVLIAVLLWADLVRRYVQVSVVPEPGNAEASGSEAGGASTWQTFFGQARPDQDQFAVIRDRNAFSPSRKAWVEAAKGAHNSSGGQKSSAVQGDVRLLGIALMGGDRKVILNIGLSGRSFTKFYGEGDAVTGPEESSGPMFKVLEIGERFVRMEDSAGEEFTVSLFDHEREGEEVIDESIYTTPTPMVIVGDTVPGDSEDASVEDGDKDGKQGSEYVSEEEETRNEQLVREGKLKKIETPFGPVYRKQDSEGE